MRLLSATSNCAHRSSEAPVFSQRPAPSPPTDSPTCPLARSPARPSVCPPALFIAESTCNADKRNVCRVSSLNSHGHGRNWLPSDGSSGAFQASPTTASSKSRACSPTKNPSGNGASIECRLVMPFSEESTSSTSAISARLLGSAALETILSMESRTSTRKFDGLDTRLRSPTARGSRLSAFVALQVSSAS